MVVNFPGWTDQTVGDESILNVCTNLSDTGDNLFNLPNKQKYKILICIEDGSGLKINHIYLVPADPAQSLIDIGGINPHTHTGNSDGGSYYDIKRANPLLFDTGPYFMINPDKALWTQTIGSGGSISNDTDGSTKDKSVKHSTGATSGTVVERFATVKKLDFTKRWMFQSAVKFGTATSLAYAGGVNEDSLSISPSNTQKGNVEVCSTNNLNFWARSADGSAPIAEDTGIAITTSITPYRIECYPDLGASKKIDFYIGNNAVWSKTTRVPSTGVSAVDKVLGHTFKTNTNGDRTVYEYGSRVVFQISDNWI